LRSNSTEDVIQAFEGTVPKWNDPPWPDHCPPKSQHDCVNNVRRRCRVASSGCWEWQGSLSGKGYGRVKINGRLYMTHRLAAFWAGMIDHPADSTDRKVCVLHECDNPRCCNPHHLKAGSMSQNMKDCVARGRHRRSSPWKNML
jgi:hypothetical protein